MNMIGSSASTEILCASIFSRARICGPVDKGHHRVLYGTGPTNMLHGVPISHFEAYMREGTDLRHRHVARSCEKSGLRHLENIDVEVEA